MKSYLPFLLFAILLSSCSSVYKSGQTPDDVYFSPERPREEYVRMEKDNDRMYGNNRYNGYNDVSLEDRYLRMKTHNRRYTFLEDDFDCYCGYNGNYYGYNNYYRMNTIGYNSNPWLAGGYTYGNTYYNPYYYNPYFKNPYYNGVVYGNLSPSYNKPRKGNLNGFGGNGNGYNPNLPKNNGRAYSNAWGSDENYRGNDGNAGGFLRNVFGSGTNNNGTMSNSSPNAGSNSNSSSSGSPNRASVRKF